MKSGLTEFMDRSNKRISLKGGVSSMTNNGIIQIHGKEYMTVARRVELAHEDKAFDSLATDVISHNPVVVKASVVIKGKTYTGTSAVSLDSGKFIEKNNPYEVAETSAVGRALGFAGYGIIESIASADEVTKSEETQEINQPTQTKLACETCGEVATEKKGISKAGKNYHGIFCSTEDKSHTKWLWN